MAAPHEAESQRESAGGAAAAPTPSHGAPTRWERTLGTSKLVAWIVLGGLLGYAGATLQAQFTLRDLSHSHAADVTRLRLLTARRDLHRAGMELERKNFGSAELRLRGAASTLLDVTAVPEAYQALAKEMREQRLPVSDDVSQERAQLFDLAQRFDELLDQPTP